MNDLRFALRLLRSSRLFTITGLIYFTCSVPFIEGWMLQT